MSQLKNPYNVREIRAAVDQAVAFRPSLPNDLLETYIASGKTVSQVRADLFVLITADPAGDTDPIAAAENYQAAHPTDGSKPLRESMQRTMAIHGPKTWES